MKHINKKKVLMMLLAVLAAATLTMCFFAAADNSAADAAEGETNAIIEGWNTFVKKFESTFITENRWKKFVNGLGTTLLITLVASVSGIVIGALTAIVRFTNAKTGRLKFLNFLANIYTTVIRGTPVAVQLLITYFVIFASVNISK
ncbi:MAG TPA: ABC transporter permease subunit, partial [Bacillota bacterium]|nr:ABC transporter permease subunit [Bacillota bacterium]